MLRDTSPQPAGLPSLSHEERDFVAAFFEVEQNVDALARRLNMDVFEIVQTLSNQTIKSCIDARHAHEHNERRTRALHALRVEPASTLNRSSPRLAAPDEQPLLPASRRDAAAQSVAQKSQCSAAPSDPVSLNACGSPISHRGPAHRGPAHHGAVGGMFKSRQSRSLRCRVVCAALTCAVGMAHAQSVSLTQSQLLDRYEGMWLGECIANWTGLRTEGARINPPFFTDADWGTVVGPGPLDFVIQSPWGSDDDTDIEYVYLHKMNQTGSVWLSPQAIRDAWRKHINAFIWVSNANARALMERGVVPPATGMSAANHGRLAIDAQLTTELFGAICPGDPTLALELSYLPIRTTSVGHASHASQFYVVLYALAPLVDQQLSGRDQSIWLVTTARDYLPPTSKARDVINTVLNDFLANPDVNNWERTRDIVYERYHQHASQNGFTYFGWTESSVNLATGVLALLYGEGDFRRTVQIGTLSGWDSDNGTATMGGLLGLVHGEAWVRVQFPQQTLSDAYWILAHAWRCRITRPAIHRRKTRSRSSRGGWRMWHEPMFSRLAVRSMAPLLILCGRSRRMQIRQTCVCLRIRLIEKHWRAQRGMCGDKAVSRPRQARWSATRHPIEAAAAFR